MMGVLLTTSGITIKLGTNPSLQRLQKAVGGYIEYVRIPTHIQSMCRFDFLYCNETGKLDGLPPNPVATMLAFPDGGDVIVGNVVLMKDNEEEEEE